MIENINSVEEARTELTNMVREEIVENVRKNQAILSTLSTVVQKITNLESFGNSQHIYHHIPEISQISRSHGPSFHSRKARRSSSVDRIPHRTPCVDHKEYVSSADSFSTRLNDSIEKYYLRNKRDSTERRNVER